jgi:diaminohydroxyphosphoribosylaminopyrimidine deaminase/5-amino-6-(5-phosphoribosylamino)uracil reductase
MNLPVSEPFDEARPGTASPDEAMARAGRLAEKAVGLSEPNPRVGCVLVAREGDTLLGEGHTQKAGSAHAEVAALQDAAARGNPVVGATAYVTLEPCAHHGRTPPCTEALIAAGVRRVVIAAGDPNPLVNGAGVAALRAAGVDVAWADGSWARQAAALNCGFFQRMRHGCPWVRLKVAASLDGRTALPNGHSQWITGEAARRDGHAWRKRSGAVLTGVGTVLADDPQLDVRWLPTALQPLRVVIDSRLDTPPAARLLRGGSPPLFYASTPAAERVRQLGDLGATVVCLPDPHGRVDLAAVLADLAKRQINELHVEAGAGLNASWIAGGFVDECIAYLAPMFMGPGRPIAELPALAELTEASRFAFHEARQLGDDLRLVLRRVA